MHVFDFFKQKRVTDETRDEFLLIASAAIFRSGLIGAYELFGTGGAICELEKQWSSDQATRERVTLEFVYIFLHWLDRTFFEILGTPRRDYAIDVITIRTMAAASRWIHQGCQEQPVPTVTAAIDWVASSLTNEYKERALRLGQIFNEFQEWASSYSDLLRPGDQSPKGTLTWEFGKRVASIFDRSGDATIILPVVAEVMAFVTAYHKHIKKIARAFERS